MPRNLLAQYHARPSEERPETFCGLNPRREPAYRVVGGGSEKLSLKYWRQWEGDTSIVKRFAVTVEAAK
jgi:predicted secreted protein